MTAGSSLESKSSAPSTSGSCDCRCRRTRKGALASALDCPSVMSGVAMFGLNPCAKNMRTGPSSCINGHNPSGGKGGGGGEGGAPRLARSANKSRYSAHPAP